MRSLLLILLPLLFLETLRKPITITAQTITITFTLPLHLIIITIEPKKHNTNRLQSNTQRPLLVQWYPTLPQTHYRK